MQLFSDTKGCKTYVSPQNAIKAADPAALEQFKWVMAVNEGRYHIVFIGQDALQHCLQKGHFCTYGF